MVYLHMLWHIQLKVYMYIHTCFTYGMWIVPKHIAVVLEIGIPKVYENVIPKLNLFMFVPLMVAVFQKYQNKNKNLFVVIFLTGVGTSPSPPSKK